MSHVTIEGPELFGPPEVQAIVMEEALTASQQALLVAEAAIKMRLEDHRKTGNLIRSFTTRDAGNVYRVEKTTGRLIIEWGSLMPEANWLDQGTGIYGPLHHMIVPKKPGGVMAWPAATGAGTPFTLTGRQRSGSAGAGATYIFATKVKGIKPLYYMTESMRETQAQRLACFQKGAEKIAHRLAVGK